MCKIKNAFKCLEDQGHKQFFENLIFMQIIINLTRLSIYWRQMCRITVWRSILRHHLFLMFETFP